MNNTASLRRTDRSLADWFTERRVATILATIVLAVMVISLRPFAAAGVGATEGGGDIVNQLGFSSLGALAVASLLTFVDRRVVATAFSPWWLILLGFFVFSIIHAIDPMGAARTAIFTFIGIISVVAFLTLPRDADSFSMALAVVGFATVGLSYFGVVFLPHLAIHSADAIEAQHAGFWRGLFSHKNIAGPVMACLSFAGLYLWRRGWSKAGILLFCAAIIFMANTGSKTTLGLVPLTICMVMGPSMIGMRPMVPVLFVLTFIGFALGTLGIVFIDPLKHLAAEYFPGLTYTGRTTLWAFAGDLLAKHPWAGWGYESLWGVIVPTMERPFDLEWDVRGIVHSHNGFLEVALIMGIPGLIAALMTFVVVPMADFLRVSKRRENIFMADLFMMFLLFTSLNSFLEAFFFRRIDPVWVFFLIGVFGLRFVSRFPVKSRPDPRR